MARPIDSGTRSRHDAYSRRAGCWSGQAPKRRGGGIPRNRRATGQRRPPAPAGLVRPNQNPMRRGIATEARISKTITIAAAIVTELVDALAVGELVALAVNVDVAGGIRSGWRSVGSAASGRSGSGRSARPAVGGAVGCPDRRVMGDAGGGRRTVGRRPADRATDGRAGTTPAPGGAGRDARGLLSLVSRAPDWAGSRSGTSNNPTAGRISRLPGWSDGHTTSRNA